MTMNGMMRILGTILAVAAGFWALSPLPAQAAVYYVSPSGSGAGDGSFSNPFSTLARAAAAASAGDAVFVSTGTYAERLVPQRSGTQGAEILFAALPGQTPVIDGAGVALPDELAGLIHLEQKAHIRISGFQVINAGPHNNNAAIMVMQCDQVVIEKNYTKNSLSSGIGVWWSTHVTVRDNQVELACNDGEQECITIAGTSGFSVTGNHVHHGGPGTNGAEGIDVKDGSSDGKVAHNRAEYLNRVGIYVDAWDKHTHGIDIYENLSVHNQADGFSLASEEGGLLENVNIYNNVAAFNQFNGLAISLNGEAASHPIQHVTVANNTFYKNGSDVWGGGIILENPDATDIRIQNNIFAQNQWYQMEKEHSGQSPTATHNLIHGFRGYEGEIRGTDYVEADPLFKDAASEDFHLTASSPAIDKGSASAAPATDFDGNLRPAGAGPDMGAFEYGSARPVLALTGSGLDGSVDADTHTPVTLGAALDAGDRAGTPADFWMVHLTPLGGLEYLDLAEGFVPSAGISGMEPVLQGNLSSFGPVSVVEISPETGVHFFYLGVDTRQNGVLDADALYFDALQVTVW